jgi:hypothetical protein
MLEAFSNVQAAFVLDACELSPGSVKSNTVRHPLSPSERGLGLSYFLPLVWREEGVSEADGWRVARSGLEVRS